MNLAIDNRQSKVIIDDDALKDLKGVIEECLKHEGRSLDYEVSLSLVDDEEIKGLNKEYRGKDSSTDVLSFPMEDDDDFGLSTPLLGDIVISLETAKRQAKEYKHSLKREITYLIVHSMFHLLGYDHLNEDDKRVMRDKEKEVMKSLKIFKNN